MFLSDGPHVRVPEVCVAARRRTPREAFAFDTPSAGVMIGAGSALICAVAGAWV